MLSNKTLCFHLIQQQLLDSTMTGSRIKKNSNADLKSPPSPAKASLLKSKLQNAVAKTSPIKIVNNKVSQILIADSLLHEGAVSR
jgi:hypothetical protein